MHSRFVGPFVRPVFTAAILAGLASSTALAQGLPAGAHTWLKMTGNWVADGTCCDTALAQETAFPLPSPNYVHDTAVLTNGGVVYAAADTSPNRLRASYFETLTTGVFIYNSMFDTYTITGPAGSAGTPVNARLIVRAVGTLFVGFTNPRAGHVGSSGSILFVGSWNSDPNPVLNEQFRVVPFDEANFTRRSNIPNAVYGSTTPTLNVDQSVDQVLTRTVGTPFDLGYSLIVDGMGCGNLGAHTSPTDSDMFVVTIDWQLPPGYSITSTHGWTSPNACVADVDDGSGSGTPDGGVTIDDLLYYLAIFEQGSLAADVDDGSGTGIHDGGVTIDDLLYYLVRFESGC